MPEETCNQPQTIEEWILDILADEAQIVRCLRIFFCKTLHEISTEKYMTSERKVKLASDLINAAAQKEAALAAVLEAISKIIDEEPDDYITLVPGASYQVTSSSPTITTITFEAKIDPGVTGGEISAIFVGEVIGTALNFNDVPANYTISLIGAFDPSQVTLQNTGIVTVYIRNVVAGGGWTMPEVFSQPQTIEEWVLDILADEAQIVRCLRIFFCKTLQEIGADKCLSPERKVNAAKDLINAAAQKEAALAAVLEAISKFEEEQPPVVCTEIEPNQSISLSNPESITSVSFTAYTETGTTTVELYDIDELILKSVVVDDTQSTVTWTVLTNPAILKNAGNATVFVCNLIVE